MRDQTTTNGAEAGFTLLEAMVALGIIAMVVTSYLGIRTNAVGDAIEARNWRLAREIAEEQMSALLAGAHEVPPESGYDISLEERYPGFHYRIYIGENAVSDMEAEIANAQAGGMSDRDEWQRNRDTYRKAQSRGLSALEYEDEMLQEEYEREMETRVPSETEFEDVAIAVFFPKVVNEEYQGQEEAFVLKTKASTLAISGHTPEQARMIAESRGEAGGATGGLEGLPTEESGR
jgi:prepilin-type N-terminal cleavage/methylation domain-containing protein